MYALYIPNSYKFFFIFRLEFFPFVSLEKKITKIKFNGYLKVKITDSIFFC